MGYNGREARGEWGRGGGGVVVGGRNKRRSRGMMERNHNFMI